ncbi:MAG: sulfotransferase [Candidatus Hodarchaeota archaeon]
MSESPIFITGVYRSGTTLPTLILNAHSKLRITFDSVQFFRFHLGKYNPIKERYAEIILEIADRLKKRFSMEIPKERILEKLSKINKISYKSVYSTIMIETFCEGNTDLRWGEKSVLEWTNIPTFLSMFPNGKTIHIIRDPRDVVASYREMTVEPKYRYLDAAFACLHSLNWSVDIGESLPSDKYYLLRHEDIVSAPEETTKKLCNFLKIDFEPEMLDLKNFSNRSGTHKWEGNTAFDDIEENISIKSMNRWKNKLRKHEILFVESIIEPFLMEKFGYELSGIKFTIRDMHKLWKYLKLTPLIQSRLNQWLITGDGVESYPSDPTIPTNWYESRINDEKKK